MMMGALLGGISFHKGLGVVHSLSHALGCGGRAIMGRSTRSCCPMPCGSTVGPPRARMVELAGRLGLGRSGDADRHLIT